MTNQTETLRIERHTYNQLLKALSNKVPEKGGIIGSSKENVIDSFYFDQAPVYSSVSAYIPNAEDLNNIINVKWASENVRFMGVIHSHLINNELSEEDIEFARAVLDSSAGLDSILMGICQLDYSYAQKGIVWYRVFQDRITAVDVVIA